MLRLVLAVALAAALLAVVTPALEDARETRTERMTTRELGRIESAAETLAREESPGARRTLTVSLPGRSPTVAPLAFAALGGIPNRTAAGVTSETADTSGRDLLAYRIAGGSTVVRRVGVDMRVVRDGETVAPDSQALVLHGGETYRLTLRLVRVRGRLAVVVGVGTMVVDVGDSSAASGRGKPPPPSDVEHG